MNERIILIDDNTPDHDGSKHSVYEYIYRDYIFSKVGYVNLEGEFVTGLTVYAETDDVSPMPEYLIRAYDTNYYKIVLEVPKIENDISDDAIINLIEKEQTI